MNMVHMDLSESAVVEHCYLVSTLYGAQPVSNDQHCATWGEGEDGEMMHIESVPVSLLP